MALRTRIHICDHPAHRVVARPDLRVWSWEMKNIVQILTAASATIFASNVLAEPLALGASIPVVEQKNQDGKVVNLGEAGGKGYVLVFFYPKADTPGCTKQACSLRDSYETLTEKKVKIFGVSADREAGQKAFKEKYELPFELLADADAKVIDAFGVPKTLGFAKRQAFLFKDGKLVWSDLSASTEKQAEDVLKFLASQPG